MFLAGPLLDYHVNGKIAERSGNDDPVAAPHGAWPCRNGGWIALSCWSDSEFARLCDVIGRSNLSTDPRLAAPAGRKSHRALIDEAISDWSKRLDANQAAEILQRAGVHAHAVNTMADLFSDPQLAARRQWRRQPHPIIGNQAYCLPAFDLSETPGDIKSAGPMLGADNERVFREFVGLSEAEYAGYRSRGVFD
jgi:benzylsuccinate CoA-transferase BbsF subunit